MTYKLPELPYAYDALEPYYDAETVRIHHDLHHKGYVDGLNNAVAKLAEAREAGDFALIKHWERELAFHGAGHILHSIFWENMSPNGGGNPKGTIAQQIEKDFGSFDAFKKHFSAATVAVEGSGWGLLVWNPYANKLEIMTAEKHQDLAIWGVVPLLVCDVWEHAYYLKYQNKRAAWVEAWWNIVNWDDVEAKFTKAK
ncbi:MAG: superoxide dismutase [Firmicutes bacterium]|nr:superoxide dismutase [Bacillota bacterium]